MSYPDEINDRDRDRDKQEYRLTLENVASKSVGMKLPLYMEEEQIEKLSAETCLAMASAHAACAAVYRSKLRLYTALGKMNGGENWDETVAHEKARAFVENQMIACIPVEIAEDIYMVCGKTVADDHLFRVMVTETSENPLGYELGYGGGWVPGFLN